MTSLEEWAARWGIPSAAVDDLCRSCIYSSDADDNASEARVQIEVRLEAARAGVYLFRNNVGAGKLDNGNYIRFGLGNDSQRLNTVLKSGDLIGLRKRLITQRDVGEHIGQFVSREVKRRDWKYVGTLQENAQMKWAALINANGGDAKIVTGTGSI